MPMAQNHSKNYFFKVKKWQIYPKNVGKINIRGLNCKKKINLCLQFFLSLILFFSDPISLNKVYPRDHTTVEGANLTLQCKVTGGNPRPKITWHSVTGNITALSHGKNLTFFNISRSDAGQYFCVAENGVEQAVPSRISSIDVQCK